MKKSYNFFFQSPAMLIIALLLCFNTNQSFSQSKKEILFSLDSLQRSYKNLKNDYKNLKEECKEYNDFYLLIKSELLQPSEMNIGPDATYAKWQAARKKLKEKYNTIKDSNSTLTDSLKQLNLNIKQLHSENKTFKNLLKSSIDKATIPYTVNEFIGHWNLFLNQVYVQGTSNESGIIATNNFLLADSLSYNNIFKIEFQESDLANIYFKDGTTIKCFYSINRFSAKNPYSIYFSKQEEFKLTLLVSPMPEGLLVSYEDPQRKDKTVYFYGLMKK